MVRVERGHEVTVTVTVIDGEDLIDADDAPVLTLTDWTGDAIGSPITSTQSTDEASDPIVGTYEATFPARAVLGPVTATWAIEVGGNARPAVDTVEVVAGRYFTLRELRALPGLESTTRFTTAALDAARTWAETVIDDAVTSSFVERHHTGVFELRPFWRDARHCIALPDRHARTVISASVDGVAVDDLTVIEHGLVTAQGNWPLYGTCTAEWTSSWSTYVPQPIRDAALTAARYHLLATVGNSGIPDRTRTISNDQGNITLSVAGADAPTGLPEVDAVILSYRDQVYVPGIA